VRIPAGAFAAEEKGGTGEVYAGRRFGRGMVGCGGKREGGILPAGEKKETERSSPSLVCFFGKGIRFC